MKYLIALILALVSVSPSFAAPFPANNYRVDKQHRTTLNSPTITSYNTWPDTPVAELVTELYSWQGPYVYTVVMCEPVGDLVNNDLLQVTSSAEFSNDYTPHSTAPNIMLAGYLDVAASCTASIASGIMIKPALGTNVSGLEHHAVMPLDTTFLYKGASMSAVVRYVAYAASDGLTNGAPAFTVEQRYGELQVTKARGQ